MKLFTAKQLHEADQLTIKNQSLTSTELMERAGTLVFNQIHQRIQGAQMEIKIFCGIGNNGGDGLVIARHLLEHGYNVKVFVVNYSDKRSKDFLINYDRYKELTNKWPELLKSEDDFPELTHNDFIVDAIFGIGLNRPLVPWVANLVKHINASRAFTLAIDVPSGLFVDEATKSLDEVIKANFTIAFQSAKLPFFLADTGAFVGDLDVIDIGLDRQYLMETPSQMQLINKAEAQQLYKPRHKFSHKGTFGHALIIGGSYGKIGATVLATKACLKSGVGMVSAFIPRCGYQVLQTSVPEAMVFTDASDYELTDIDCPTDMSVIGFGIGAGTSDNTIQEFERLLEKTERPMVIDADGINMLSNKNDLLQHIPKKSILTPHPKELKRLIGEWNDDFEMLAKAKSFSKKHDVILVCKNAHTISVYHDDIYINNTGNQGMATAGSGDTLTGMLSGLIAQDYDPVVAAVFGVYLHGAAGDIAVNRTGFQSLTASDLIDTLGMAYIDLFQQEAPQQQDA
jgi:hydroxyethylthiazole kinase-like uncharacterized protein yjeF